MKIAAFTDIHWGKGSNDRSHNERCLVFVRWYARMCAELRIDRSIFLGDWHDNRNLIGVETLDYSNEGLSVLKGMDIPCDFIVGNHDMPFRNSRKKHSMGWMMGENIRVIDSPIVSDGILLVPFLVEDDNLSLVASMARDCEFVFGHFELPGFFMNERFAMPHRDGHLTGDELEGPRYVFSGHFHARQTRRTTKGTTICYIGNCFPHDFSDADDLDRGMMVIESGGDPQFIRWPDQPTYHRVPVSMLADVAPTLGSNAIVRAFQDVELDAEDRAAVRGLASDLGIAKITLEPAKPKELDPDKVWDGSGDLDGFIMDWLSDPKNSESIKADPGVMKRRFLEAKR